MNIVQKSRAVQLSIGLFAASAVLIPLSVSAATLYVADYGGSIKQISSTGTVTTFATGLGDLYGLAFDGSGNLFAADNRTGSVRDLQVKNHSSFDSGM